MGLTGAQRKAAMKRIREATEHAAAERAKRAAVNNPNDARTSATAATGPLAPPNNGYKRHDPNGVYAEHVAVDARDKAKEAEYVAIEARVTAAALKAASEAGREDPVGAALLGSMAAHIRKRIDNSHPFEQTLYNLGMKGIEHNRMHPQAGASPEDSPFTIAATLAEISEDTTLDPIINIHALMTMLYCPALELGGVLADPDFERQHNLPIAGSFLEVKDLSILLALEQHDAFYKTELSLSHVVREAQDSVILLAHECKLIFVGGGLMKRVLKETAGKAAKKDNKPPPITNREMKMGTPSQWGYGQAVLSVLKLSNALRRCIPVHGGGCIIPLLKGSVQEAVANITVRSQQQFAGPRTATWDASTSAETFMVKVAASVNILQRSWAKAWIFLWFVLKKELPELSAVLSVVPHEFPGVYELLEGETEPRLMFQQPEMMQYKDVLCDDFKCSQILFTKEMELRDNLIASRQAATDTSSSAPFVPLPMSALLEEGFRTFVFSGDARVKKLAP